MATVNSAGEAFLTTRSDAERGRESPDPSASQARSAGSPSPPGLLDKLLQVPLFYKILLANAVILAIAVLIGVAIIVRTGTPATAGQTLELATILGASAIVVGAACSAFITRLALTPLRDLEAAAQRVEEGELETRVLLSPLADADMRRLAAVLNRMLDRVEWYRLRQQEVTVRSLASEERAKTWVASKLYDECAQSLAAVLLQLRAASKRAGERQEENLENLRTAVLETLESIRQVARELRPPELDEIGLVPALAAEVRTLSGRTGIQVRLDAEPLTTELSPEAGLALYRIVHEALANAVQHAGARNVAVRIVRRQPGVAAEIHDDGTGFDVEEELERAGRGLGLLEMKERARHVGADLSIRSSPLEGTTIRIDLPLGNEDRDRATPAAAEVGPERLI